MKVETALGTKNLDLNQIAQGSIYKADKKSKQNQTGYLLKKEDA